MENANTTSVCVLTGRQTAAIGSVAIAGGNAHSMLAKAFRPSQTKFSQGSILHGKLFDGDQMIDEVVIGCEEEDYFVVHCHGNPLITERTVKLFESMGANLMESEAFLFNRYRSESKTIIEAEAKLYQQKAATLAGAKIISNQLATGLLPTARKWLDGLEVMTLEELWAQCHQVLRKSTRARYLINKCKIAIVGPPNSGKSTLLNTLASKEQAIVSDVAGTTRDYVSITCRLGPLLAEVYDTAGLDPMLAQAHEIDKTAQEITRELLDMADISIFVYDAARARQAQLLMFNLGSFKAVIAANKCDLLTPATRENVYSKYIPISAKTGQGIDRLIETIAAALKVDDFDVTAPICFTERQLAILRQIIHTHDKEQAKALVEKLLYGQDYKLH